MKTKLVLWGKDDQDGKVLIAIQLRAEDNQADVWTFHGEEATSDLHKKLLYEWREGKEMAFPATGYQHHEGDLSATGRLLPENVFAEKEELVERAKTEWHFVVLSSKLNEVYQIELVELREKIEGAENYSADKWNTLKGFWDKVRGQMQDNNLSRDHANSLKRQVNELFSRLKELRSSQEEEFQSNSLKSTDKFNKSLDEVNARVEKGEMLHLVFEELKTIQRDFRSAKLTREDRSKLWERIDGAFKAVKERRFGPSPTGNTPVDRHQHRLNGLVQAIEKMERSIQRDHEDLDAQERKKGSTSIGQLESQLLDAKINIIKGRVKSKETKLQDMHKTRVQVEEKLKQAKQRMEEKAAKVAAPPPVEKSAEPKAAAKEVIVDKKDAPEAAKEAVEEKTEAAKELVAEKVDKPIEAAKEAVEEKVETAKEVVTEKVDTPIEAAKEAVEEKAEAAKEAVAEKVDTPIEAAKEAVEEKAEAAKEVVAEKVDTPIEAAKEAVAEKVDTPIEAAKEAVEEKVEAAKEAIAEKVDTPTEAVKEAIAEKAEAAKNLLTGLKEKVASTEDEA